MRTTLDIDDDLYLFAREQAARERVSIGKTISFLIRQGVQRPVAASAMGCGTAFMRNGIPLIGSPAQSTRIVTQELIDRIRDDEGI